MSRFRGCGMDKDEFTHALRVLWFAITGTTLVVCGLFFSGRLNTQATDLDFTALLAVSTLGAIVTWLLYKR